MQTIPFTEHVNQLFHSEDGLPVFDWGSGLGMDFLAAYGGFVLTPFAFLLCIVPTAAYPYVHTLVIALKMGVAAVTACGYCRQYVKTNRSAYLCGMLYAFSGFQLFNMVYQFMDTICLFPLLLFTFDRLVTKNQPLAFAFMLGLNGFISYFFLWEECLFLLIYFVVRTATKNFPALTVKKFIQLAIETLFGVGLSSVVLVTAVKALSGNKRAGDLIFSENLLAFEDTGVLLRMIQSMFLPPDICGMGWYFSSRQLSLSPPALYIPLFTVIGISAVFRKNRKSWYSILLIVCTAVACVPVINSVFAMFNGNYYSRWFYMPLLIMIMMTGIYLDEIETFDIRKEMKVSVIITGFLAVFGIYSVYVQHKVFPEWTKTLWLWETATALVGIGIMYLLYHPQEKLSFFSMKNLSILTCICCVLPFFERNLGISQQSYSDYCKNEIRRLWNGFEPIDLQDDQYFRIGTADSPSSNLGINWGYPTVTLFNSLVSGEESSFYSRVGIQRPHSSPVNTKDYPIQSFLSVKYDFYLNLPLTGEIYNEPKAIIDAKMFKKEGYTDYKEYGYYIVFENSAFIPMGFTYDYYLNVDDFEPLYTVNKKMTEEEERQQMMNAALPKLEEEDTKTSTIDKEKLLLKAIWLTDAQIEKYEHLLEPLPDSLKEDLSVEAYYQDCADRAASACYEFNTNNEGFTARINLEKENLVFFSLPYAETFTAYVDGAETEIERVFDGLCAVCVPEGDHEIAFHYEVPGLKAGIALSVASTAVLVIYGAVFFILKKKEQTRKD